MKYTLEEKMFMYKKCMSLGSPTLVQRAWRTKYVCSTAPKWSTIIMTAKKFEKTGSVINLQARKRITSQKRKNGKISSKKLCQKILHYRSEKQAIAKISCSLTRLVLKNDLGLKPYKKPDLLEIETNDYPNTYGHHIND
jgi:hypothetical protein